MAGRALLIGSRTFGLQGCDADVQLVASALRRRGFEAIDVRTGVDAGRASLIDAFEALIAATEPTDPVVVYYSGHGARLARADHAVRIAAGRSPFYQFLVPYDMAESDDDDFRGLLAEEITAFQRRLTDSFLRRGAPPNVTTILDCCHAGHLARDLSLRPKAIPSVQTRALPLKGIRRRTDSLPPEPAASGWDSNPYAVRLVAAQEEQSAYEREGARGTHGLLTEALADVLEELGERLVPWGVLGDLVRRRVQRICAEQRPEVEGPTTLLPFSTRHGRDRNSLPVVERGGHAVIEAAPLLGMAVGDRFRLNAPQVSADLGSAEVAAMEGGDAVLDLTLNGGAAALPPGTQATPLRLHLSRRAVAVGVGAGSGADLRQRIAAAPRLTVAEPDERTFAAVVLDLGLRVLDELGAPACSVPFADDEAGRQQVVDLLDRLARARTLSELGSGEGDAHLGEPVAVSFAVVEDGRRSEQSRHGARLRVGDHVSVRLRNLSQSPLYFWLFDVGISGTITLVTNAAPSGYRLAPGGEPDDTRTVWGAGGAKLAWPAAVPGAEVGAIGPVERLETFVIVIADRPQDLKPLETVRGARSGAALSPLDLVLEAVRRGTREVPVETGEQRQTLRYRIERIQFFLQPPR